MKGEADFEKARRNRRFHFLAQAALMVGLAIGVNFLATRFFVRTDLGLAKRSALSAETKKVLEGLGKPVDVIVTITDSVDPDQPRLLNRLLNDLKLLLASLEGESSEQGRVRTHFVNVFKRQGENEEIVAKYELRQQNQVLVACGDRILNVFRYEDGGGKRGLDSRTNDSSRNARLLAALESIGLYGGWEVDSLDRPVPTIFRGEEVLLRAIRKVSSESTRKAYFLVGHEEMALSDSNWNETRGLSEMKSLLDRLNIETTELQLGSDKSKRVPEDASLVVIASPQNRLSDKEAHLLQGYLSERRGSMLLLLDPVYGMEDHGLTSLLRSWDLGCDDMRLVEPAVEKSNLTPKTIEQDGLKGSHPIVAFLAKHEIPIWVFPQGSRGRPVFTRTDQASEGVTVTDLLTSSSESWAEDDWRNKDLKMDPKRRNLVLNEAGPLSFACAAERRVRSKHGIDIPGGKLVVFGNSTLFCNLGLLQNGNRTLFSNVTHWLLDENEFLDIPPKPLPRYEMNLDSEEFRTVLYHLSVLPGLVALIGLSRRMLRRDS